MDLQETLDTLNNLDPNNIGAWPMPVKLVIWVLAIVLAAALTYQVRLSESFYGLSQKQKEEVTLLEDFEKKAFQSANLDRLRKQMEEMQTSFGALVRQLPSDTEVPGLLEDISQLGLDSGLEFDSIGLGKETVLEFYAELPIKITVKGSYHALGNFVSGIAALPRIVTLHDYSIKPHSDKGLLSMSIMAKTYRYNSEGGI